MSYSVSGQAEEHLVSQKDKKFSQVKIKVKVGDTITFKNEEKDIVHNVYSLGPKNAFDVLVQEPGKSSTVVIKEKGTTDIECAIHPGMNIKVEAK